MNKVTEADFRKALAYMETLGKLGVKDTLRVVEQLFTPNTRVWEDRELANSIAMMLYNVKDSLHRTKVETNDFESLSFGGKDFFVEPAYFSDDNNFALSLNEDYHCFKFTGELYDADIDDISPDIKFAIAISKILDLTINVFGTVESLSVFLRNVPIQLGELEHLKLSIHSDCKNNDLSTRDIGVLPIVRRMPRFSYVYSLDTLRLENLHCGWVSKDDVPLFPLCENIFFHVKINCFSIECVPYNGRNMILYPRYENDPNSSDDTYEKKKHTDNFLDFGTLDYNIECGCLNYEEMLTPSESGVCRSSYTTEGIQVLCRGRYLRSGSSVNVPCFEFSGIDLDGRLLSSYALWFMNMTQIRAKRNGSARLSFYECVCPIIRYSNTTTPDVWEKLIALMKNWEEHNVGLEW